MPRLLTLIPLLAVFTACGGEPPSQADKPDGLHLSLSPVRHAGSECRVLRVAEIDQDRQALYMLRGNTVFTNVLNNEATRIPLQIQLRGLTGVQRESVTSLPELNVPCASVAVSIIVEECMDHDRQSVSCPTIHSTGNAQFAGVSIQSL